MRISVIPARVGSKRIPRKNVREFAGKPMISYAIEAARESGLFDHILVSTDDEEIAETACAFGAEAPFRRPAGLADDFTPTVPVIAHAIRACAELGWHADEVCCIYPCAPLIEPEDLKRARRLLGTGIASFVFPVAKFPSAIQRALRCGEDGRLRPFDPAHVNARTQDLESAYYDAGQFYWGGAEAWLEGRDIHADAAGIEIPEWRAVDIDTQEDWRRAEALFGALRGQA